MRDLVSILIPAYNAAHCLGATLESALAQSWPHKEVIVVDDGSADRTAHVARTFESRGVRLICTGNRGASAARNTALRVAEGSYIQFLDADDLLAPDKLAMQLHGADDGLRSRVLLTGAWGRFFVRPTRARLAPDVLWQDLAPVDWIVNKFMHNTFMFPGSWLVSRKLITDAGMWDEALSLDDDGEYMCRLVAASEQVRFVDVARSFYRIGNSASLSARKSEAAMRSEWRSLGLCIGHLLALEDSDRTRQACVRLLQDSLQLFEPSWPELAGQCRALARALGGELTAAPSSAHFRLASRIVGHRTAGRIRALLNRGKLGLGRTMERLPRLAFETH